MMSEINETPMYDEVFDHGLAVVDAIRKTQREAIGQAAEMVAKAFVEGHRFLVSGSGHSHTLTEELYGRAGGLAFVTPILTDELTMTSHPTKSSAIERLSGYAEILGDLYRISEGDVVLIASNLGRNAYPVELASYAKSHGAHVIAITSVAHSSSCTSRVPSGEKLMDVADVVIDNCGVLGDSCLSVPGVPAAMMPTSSIANAFIAQALSVAAAAEIAKRDVEPPVFESLNADPTINRNDEYYERYTRMY